MKVSEIAQQQEHVATVEKSKTNVRYNWAWLLVLPLLYVGFRLYKEIS
jgi:hypothetical protein